MLSGTDEAGNQSNQATLTVTNIDKVVPTVVYGTNGSVGGTASTSVTVSDSGGSSLNTSTLQYVWDTQNSTTPNSGWASFTNGGTLTKSGTVGTYYLWVKALDNVGNVKVSVSSAFGIVTTINNFNYTGTVQNFVAPITGNYKLEVWGAQGGNATVGSTSSGGKGGYSTGIISLNSGETIYIYVGGQGQESVNTNLISGGWNGGGGNYSAGGGATGGGATDIRRYGQALTNRIIVAGGGSGAAWGNINGSAGGGLTGVNGVSWSGYALGLGGSQASGGSYSGNPTGGGQKQSITSGSLGVGGRGSGSSSGGSGGGGGYYGGGGGMISGGGGGSSYIAGLSSASTIAGNTSIPAPGGGNEVGHPGNGYARISIFQ